MVDKKVAGIAIGAGLIGAAIWIAASKSSPKSASLQGNVWDAGSGDPIANATVTLNDYSTTTDVYGNYSIANITPGSYTLTFTKSGYESFSEEIIILTGGDHARHAFLTAIGAINTISFSLLNPPAEVDVWQFGMSDNFDQNKRFTDYITVTQPVSWGGLPDTFQFPALLILMGYQWVTPGEVLRQVYQRQSYWGSEYDGYDPQFVLPTFGNYQFNFITGEIERVD